MHISASATASPPSLTSWHDRDEAGADRLVRGCGSAGGVAGRARAPGLAGVAEHEVEVAAGELAARSPPTRTSTLPARLRSGVTHGVGVGHVGDGGDHERRRHRVALRRRRRGTRCSASPCRRRTVRRGRVAASQQPSTAATRSPSVDGRRGSPHEKLSSSATVSGSAPTATTLRIASSTTACAMRSGSCRPYHGLTPMPMARPCVSAGSASTTPSAGRRAAHRRAGGRRWRRGSRGRSGGWCAPWRRCWGGRAGRAGRRPGRRTVGAATSSRGGRRQHRRVIARCGRPSCRNSVSRSSTTSLAGAHAQQAVAGERAEVGELDAVTRRTRRAVAATGRRGDRDTIRSCASVSQISHGRRPGYLSGAEGEVDVGADALGHLADRRRQPAGAAVGDRRVQAVALGAARRSAASR